MANRAPAEAVPISAEAVAAPARSRHRESRRVRTSLKVSSPSDAAEREAETTARRVVAMPAPIALGPIARRMPLMPARAPAVPVPRPKAPPGAAAPPAKAAPPQETSPELEGAIRKELGGGRPLPKDVVDFMAPRFKASFAGVRIHTGARAANLATRLGASAFTFGRDIFFNAGAFRPESKGGMELIAHELTHTIQQREVVQRETAENAPVEVHETSAPKVQRGVIGKALDWIADKAGNIPGFRLFTIILGVNPINMSPVERSGANILRALVEFLPGGGLIVQALDGYGIFDKVGGWIEGKFRELGMVGSAFRDALMEFVDSLGASDILSPGSVISRGIAIFTAPVQKALSFGKGLVTDIVKFVREAILKPLAALAEGKPGYTLLKAVLGEDPVTGEAVAPTPDMVIGGFMELIGQQEIWENIKKANAIPRAWAWFKTAITGLANLVKSIPKRFMDTLKSLEIMDLVLPHKAFIKVGTAFASFYGDFLSWGLGTVLKLLEIVFEVVAPAAVPYIKKAAGAFSTILKNPIGFVGTLVAAGKLGFQQFAKNFLKHLQAALVGWLTGTMAGAGVYIPKGFNLQEILKFALSVLGLTWANIRPKLVKATNETVVKALETGFALVRTLVTQGPAAAWKQILEGLTNLKEMVIEAIKDYVKSKVVEIAVTKLLSMLSPAGAFIQAIIAIYNTIMFFVERIRQIAAVAASFIDSIAAIAAGAIAPAAGRVERTMAGMLVLVISFLARLAGLGKVSDAVKKLINKVRKPIDKALDKVVAWIVAQAKKLGKLLLGKDKKPVPPAKGDKPTDGELGKTVTFSAPDGGHRLFIDSKGQAMLASTLKPLSAHLKDFRKDAKSLTGPDKSTVLGAIGSASPLAKNIEKNAKAAKKKLIGTKDRDDLDKQIEKDEDTLRPFLKTILDTLNVKVPDQLPPMTYSFNKAPGLDMAEYARQLGGQATAINKMSVEVWLGRRMQFAEFKKRARAEGKTGKKVSGRDPRSGKAQTQAKVAIFEMIVQRLMMPQKATGPIPTQVAADSYAQAIVDAVFGSFSETTRRKGLARSTALKAVEPYKIGVAALHEPDQVVGGKFDEIGGLGLSDVNSDIGANWGKALGKPRHLANDVERDVTTHMRKIKVSRAFWRKTKMNVVLT